jgi:DNA-binding PadR family transcriptional regulator
VSLLPLDPKKRPPLVTPKQIAILRALVKRNPDGSYLDAKELIERCAPGTTRGAMICSLRHLHMHGLVREDELVTRRGRRVRTYAATQKGLDLIRPNAGLPSGGVSVKASTP